MKINPGWRPLGADRSRPDTGAKPAAVKSFADVLNVQDEQRTIEQLQEKLKDIHNQGERLARSMTVRELKLYRQMVKQFLEDTVRRGVGMKETRGFDRRGRTKRYMLLEEIDQSLVTMGEELLESEEGRLKLLQSIGDIRGMLINLFF
ncbi:YaaR family protein [Paenibacillus sp. MWE-103]|uniref:YaaR family protein n=1 Tax=Paenibacillus artemisiicola TaxID=1172618 RepID=A0ABS3WIK6_9BACL|nr:YaaR family protein [Paenibacillus artemisiicola]MBO7748078.1 YaaR family protein [Paenibacillus artemisiicola]